MERRRPSTAELEQLKELIRARQSGARPRGMPPIEGLLYQPIPLPGFEDLQAERDGSQARLDVLRDHLEFAGRRVLDLGCANGFFLFGLTEGANSLACGVGVDHFQGNVAVATALAEQFGLEQLSFIHDAIDHDLLDRVLEERWDVILLLSVHHHLARSLGVPRTREVIGRLIEAAPVVVLEQGSLTQAEYEEWTGRDEPFSTRAFSRLVSMIEACGGMEADCLPLGEGRYLSGLRPDVDGAGRAMVAHVRGSSRLLGVQRKRHRNGIYMELLHVGAGSTTEAQLWKNVVTGPSLAHRERRALSFLAPTELVPRLVDDPSDPGSDTGLLRMEHRRLARLRDVASTTRARAVPALARALLTFAEHGIVHHELCEDHVLWDLDREDLCFLDWETARFNDETHADWHREVAAPNPALGLGGYPRSLVDSDPDRCDLVAARALVSEWGLEGWPTDLDGRYLDRLGRGGAA